MWMLTHSSVLPAFLLIVCALPWTRSLPNSQIVFDDSSGFGRTFDGIGGLSGGGATSKLLVNYPEDKRNQILDYLFKPNFGASLHILKVEIGGDVQSTDGTEASHMHTPDDENYQRGYEWWLMKEAKARNPNIKLYGLPWGFPHWIGQGTESPYGNITATADYVIRWINGAKTHHNLTIDFVGIWNEKPYNIQYIKTLRAMLDQRGFQNTRIIASDGGWGIADDMLKDAELTKDVYMELGRFGSKCMLSLMFPVTYSFDIMHSTPCKLCTHYPGTTSSASAVKTGNALWASEDYSTFNDLTGGGCWARILNQNYVNGLMTSTISWNLIASYYPSLPFNRCGLMTAVEPWSGNYSVDSPIWLTAHTSQFSSIGWKYQSHGAGVGKLPKGGSYVALASPVGNQLTIVIETMSHDHSVCIRPRLPQYSVQPQTVTISLKGSYAPITQMNVWYSKLDFSGNPSTLFAKQAPLPFKDGTATLQLGVDEVITLTTLTVGQKGSYPNPSPSQPFPLPYKDDFESYQVNQEPYNLAQQSGSWEVVKSGENQIIRQMVLRPPVDWCNPIYKPFSVIGDSNWKDVFVEIDFYLPPKKATCGVFVAARANKGGCDSWSSNGIFMYIGKKKWVLANSLSQSKGSKIYSGYFPKQLSDTWHRISLYVKDNNAMGAIDGKGLFTTNIPTSPANGFVAIGTNAFGLADFDNLMIASHSDGLDKMKSYFHQSDLKFVSEKH